MKNQIERAEPRIPTTPHVHECGIEGGSHRLCFCVVCNESYPNKEFVERAEPSRGAPDARCAVCGWPLAETPDKGCRPGDCSVRPLPTIAYDTDRANREYTAFWGERSSHRWDKPAISENEKLRAGHVVLLEALRRRQKEGHGHGCIFFLMNGNRCDCGFVEAEAAILQAERT